MMSHHRKLLASVIGAWLVVLVAGCGIEDGVDNSELEGIWSVTRGDLHLTVTFSIGGGEQEVETHSGSGELVALDPADFPPELEPLVNQWNEALDELNAELDAALPPEVIVTFPNAWTMTLTDPAEPANSADGLFVNDQYLFIGDLSGAGEGDELSGGAILGFASIDGRMDRPTLTSDGKIARTLVVFLFGPDGTLFFSVQISVDFTAERTADVPLGV